MLTYLRTGHAPLNRHLHHIHAVESPACPHCPETEESVKHFLFECPEYRSGRAKMRKQLRRDAGNLKHLLTTRVVIAPLARYVAETGRWNSLGEALRETQLGRTATRPQVHTDHDARTRLRQTTLTFAVIGRTGGSTEQIPR